jgi:hypothetical protein
MGELALNECPPCDFNGDGSVSFSDVAVAQQHAAEGCPGSSTPTATETSTPTETDTPTEVPDTTTPTEVPDTTTPTEGPDTTTPTEVPDTTTPTEVPDTTTPTEVPDTNTPTEAPDTTTPTEVPDTNTPTEVPDTNTPTEAPDTTTPTDAPDETPTQSIETNTPTEAADETPTQPGATETATPDLADTPTTTATSTAVPTEPSGQMTTLSGDIGEDDDTIPVEDATDFAPRGVVRIDDELIAYSDIQTDAVLHGLGLPGILIVAQRGFMGTTPQAHSIGSAVTFIPPPSCRGDCNGDGQVSINELIRGVNIALGDQAVTVCLAVDADQNGRVAINELIQAVTSSLQGCGG